MRLAAIVGGERAEAADLAVEDCALGHVLARHQPRHERLGIVTGAGRRAGPDLGGADPALWIVSELPFAAAPPPQALAAQIKSAAQDIQALEEVMQTPAWRLVESLR